MGKLREDQLLGELPDLVRNYVSETDRWMW